MFHLKPFFGGLHYRYQLDSKVSDKEKAYKALIFMAGYRLSQLPYMFQNADDERKKETRTT